MDILAHRNTANKSTAAKMVQDFIESNKPDEVRAKVKAYENRRTIRRLNAMLRVKFPLLRMACGVAMQANQVGKTGMMMKEMEEFVS